MKSLTGSKGRLSCTAGRMPNWLLEMSSVCPSGLDLATSCVPMMPPAPARLSTTTGWPSMAESRSENARAARSVPPPGPVGTTRVTGPFG
ncbi:Uncharacterised protein [Bordetella pertussis]|nr:Uncharacterised protein [Bordetella pertussis]CFV98130.1 Uncharacterised protein [Bordetella pertussis]